MWRNYINKKITLVFTLALTTTTIICLTGVGVKAYKSSKIKKLENKYNSYIQSKDYKNALEIKKELYNISKTKENFEAIRSLTNIITNEDYIKTAKCFVQEENYEKALETLNNINQESLTAEQNVKYKELLKKCTEASKEGIMEELSKCEILITQGKYEQALQNLEKYQNLSEEELNKQIQELKNKAYKKKHELIYKQLIATYNKRDFYKADELVDEVINDKVSNVYTDKIFKLRDTMNSKKEEFLHEQQIKETYEPTTGINKKLEIKILSIKNKQKRNSLTEKIITLNVKNISLETMYVMPNLFLLNINGITYEPDEISITDLSEGIQVNPSKQTQLTLTFFTPKVSQYLLQYEDDYEFISHRCTE